MSNANTIYTLPRSGERRETLRTKGQFWTPDWVADFMVAYVLKEMPEQILDPALGEGVFFRAAKRYAQKTGFKVELFGRDVDSEIILHAKNSGLSEEDLRNVEIKDFVLSPPRETFPAIVANPPYIRHHRLSPSIKQQLRKFANDAIKSHIDGRAGLHVYFLIRSLLTLTPNGRLAYIVSADICEGVFSSNLWNWICSHYRLDAVVSFAAEATPFPDVDTNALVFLIRNAQPASQFDWVRCSERESRELISLATGKHIKNPTTIQVHRRSVDEALETGLSRPPSDRSACQYTLGDFASVMRGIVTGDNDFFFLTTQQAKELGIPDTLLVKAVGRTRDIHGDQFDSKDMEALDIQGRPTRVLNVNGIPFEKLPVSVQEYLEEGEKRGLPNKTLIKTRNPWYRMETRKCPPILFAYLGRRDARFIRNYAKAIPLTCLLCVYPNNPSKEFIERLWRVLSHPETISNLRKVGKSYGGDAIKVEPRALERLPIPDALIQKENLQKYGEPQQLSLNLTIQ